MPPFNNLIPNTPLEITEIIIYIVAGLGAILIAYAVFLKAEKRQDVLLLIGSGCLIVYSLYISNLIFLIAMGGLFFASLIEWLEILFGLHKDLGEEKKQLENKQNPHV